jgi:hypothetical protein
MLKLMKPLAVAAMLTATLISSASAKCTSDLECKALQINRARNVGPFFECRTSFIAKAYVRGDPHIRRTVDEYHRRGGGSTVDRGVGAANSMRGSPDWQLLGARADRACAKYAR